MTTKQIFEWTISILIIIGLYYSHKMVYYQGRIQVYKEWLEWLEEKT